MNLPKNARVAVVDNTYDEVSDLLAVLASEGVATLYYSGPRSFPTQPLKGVRLLFLDLELDGLRGQDDKMKASAAASNFLRLIAPDNGPVVVVLWTRHEDLEALVSSHLRNKSKVPVSVVCISKADCREDGGFSARRIKALLSKKLTSTGVIGLYVAWENAVFEGSVNLANRFARIAPADAKWPTIMSRAFFKMYEANSGENSLAGVKDQFVSACEPYGLGLLGEIRESLRSAKVGIGQLKLHEHPVAGVNDDLIAAKVNAFLYYDRSCLSTLEPGMVLKVRSKLKYRNILRGIVVDFYATKKKTKDADITRIANSDAVSLCKIIITPPCDCAQNKEFNPSLDAMSSEKYQHVAWAILVKHGAFEVQGNKSRCYKELTNFEYLSERYDLLVDLDTVCLENILPKTRALKRLFSLRPMPLADIQSKAANQLNRIGICSVK